MRGRKIVVSTGRVAIVEICRNDNLARWAPSAVSEIQTNKTYIHARTQHKKDGQSVGGFGISPAASHPIPSSGSQLSHICTKKRDIYNTMLSSIRIYILY